MIREIIDMIPFRSLAEEAVNCWLSYTMSMPVSFDLPVIFLFLLQYLGIRQIWNLIRQMRNSVGAHEHAMVMEFSKSPETSLKL